MARLIGIKEWDFGAVTSPQHHAKVEVRMKTFKRALLHAMNDGQIKDRRTLEIVLAAAVITQTQNLITHGATAFTRLTGAIPRTISDLVPSAYEPEINLNEVTSPDADVIAALTYHAEQKCAWFQETRDAAHRNAMYSRLVSES